MFGIKINGNFLDLEPAASLKYTLNNPFFDPDAVGRSFNFPLTIPLTPRNRQTLNFPERLDHTRLTYEFTGATLFLMHLPFEVGTLTISSTGPDYAEATLQNIESTVLDDLQEIRIHEILDTITNGQGIPEAVWIFDIDGNAGTYQIEIDGQTATFNATVEPPSGIAEGITNAINALFPGMAFWAPGQQQLRLYSEQVNTYHPNLQNLVKITFNSAIPVGESKWQQFVSYINDLNNNPVPSHCFPVLNWPTFYKGGNARYNGSMNVWTDAGGGAPLGNNYDDSPWWFQGFVPQVKLPYIFSKFLPLVGLADVGGDFWNEADIQKLILLYNRAIDELSEDYTPAEKMQWINHCSDTFDLNRHVPEMTARELLDGFTEFFQLWLKIEDGILYFFEKKNQLAAAPLDWSGKISDPKQTTREKDGYRLTYERDTNDTAAVPGQLDDYTNGNEEDIYRTRFSTAPYTDNNIGFAGKKAPLISQAGSSNEAGLGDNAFRPRFLFFHGLQPSAPGTINYPFASHDNYAADGTKIGDRSLDFSAPTYGLYQTSWKGIPELNKGNTITFDAALSINDLLQLRKWETPRVQFDTPDGRITGIIKQIRINATHDGLGLSSITLVKQ